MGHLIQGKWHVAPLGAMVQTGGFQRAPSQFRQWIGGKEHPAVADRYHLYVSYACPWAHRTILFRKFKELEEIIPMTVVAPHMGAQGWSFGEEKDPLYGKSYLHELYTLADPTYTGRVTVPVLWDKVRKTIVNNESSEIIRMFNSAFDDLTDNVLDFYPAPLRGEIDGLNAWIYHAINNGVYKAGFAKEQKVYVREVEQVFAALDVLEEDLSDALFVCGDALTEADWRLFTTLARFDAVYYTHFKCNVRRIMDYPKLFQYLVDLYEIEGVAETVRMDHIKTHYYTSHPSLNPHGIVPLGPVVDYWRR